MSIELHDIIGTIGVSLILLCYLLLQIGRMHSHQLSYSILNMLGAGLILFSLYFEFNLSAALIEGFWVVISLIGIFRYFKVNKPRS